MENFSDLQNICIKLFDEIAKITSIFILPLFLGRIVFSNVIGEGVKAFATLKGVVVYFCLITGFPYILDILFSIPESFLPKYTTATAITAGSPSILSSSIIPFALDRILEVLLAGLYWVVYYLHIFFMIIMCSMAPIVFLLSTILGVGLGLEIFIGLLIIGSTWPIIWYGFDSVHTALAAKNPDAFGSKCLELLLTIFKGLAPVTFSSLAVKSPAGQAISRAAQVAMVSTKIMGAQMKKAPAVAASAHGRFSAWREGRNRKPNQYQFNGGVRDPNYSGGDRLKRARSQSQGVKVETPR